MQAGVITNVSLTKDFVANLGAGVSTVNIDNLIATGLFNLTTGDGADVVNIERGNFFGNSTIAKLATIQTGNGADTIFIGDDLPAPNGGLLDGTRVRFLGGPTLDGGLGADVSHNIATENDFPGSPPTITNVP